MKTSALERAAALVHTVRTAQLDLARAELLQCQALVDERRLALERVEREQAQQLQRARGGHTTRHLALDQHVCVVRYGQWLQSEALTATSAVRAEEKTRDQAIETLQHKRRELDSTKRLTEELQKQRIAAAKQAEAQLQDQQWLLLKGARDDQ